MRFRGVGFVVGLVFAPTLAMIAVGCSGSPIDKIWPPDRETSPATPDLPDFKARYSSGVIEVASDAADRVELVERLDRDGVPVGWTVRVRGATDFFEGQENKARCTAAAVNMVRKIRGQRRIDQAELVRRHQRSLEALALGGRVDAAAIRRVVESVKFQGRPALRADDALMGWEIQDALSPGHLDEMRENGFLVLGPHAMGLPLGSEKKRAGLGAPNNHWIGKSIAEGEPALVTLLTTANIELNRHAYVVVGVEFSRDWEAEQMLLLNPSDIEGDPMLQPMGVAEFDARVRTIATVPLVKEEQAFEKEWVDRAELEPGFHVRQVHDRSLLEEGWRLLDRSYETPPAESILLEEVLPDEPSRWRPW